MARPKKKGLDYFPHDTDASNDEKIEALRLLYGNDGYAFYFILLERIYRTNECELDISDAETIQILSKKVAVSEEKFRKMLETSFKYGCFDRESYEKKGVLTSNGIKKRMAPVLEKRAKMQEKYYSDKDKDLCGVSDAETKKKLDKEKKRKEKKSNINNPYDFLPERDDRFVRLQSFYENKISLQIPVKALDGMQYWLDNGKFDEPEQIIMMAINEMSLRKIKDWNYAQAILENWSEKKLRTVQAVKNHQMEYEVQRKRQDFKVIPSGPYVPDAEQTKKMFEEIEKKHPYMGKKPLTPEERREYSKRVYEVIFKGGINDGRTIANDSP